jgi:peroxiredoxin
MPVDVGTKVKDFTVLKADGEKVEAFKLSDHVGKEALVLAFFPLAFTGVCTAEMCTFRDSIAQFNDLKAKVLGVSVDSPFTQNQFIQKEKLTFSMLSDFNRELVDAFGVKRTQPIGPAPGLLGVANRSVFIVGKDGAVKYRWFSENPKDLPPFDEVKAALGKLS